MSVNTPTSLMLSDAIRVSFEGREYGNLQLSSFPNGLTQICPHPAV